jgi:hypothetical protein
MLVGRGCSRECCSGGIRNYAEKGICQRANCQVLLRWYLKYAEHHVGVMSGTFFYQYCLTGERVPQNFLTHSQLSHQSPSAPALRVLFPAAKPNTARAKTTLREILLLL